ncbi:hypothetical protein JST97_17725 [bacterium]|nr:hypothetical protein [bacterium]
MEFSWIFTLSDKPEWSVCKTLEFAPSNPGTPWRYLLVSRHERPWLRICLHLQDDESHAFEDCLYWQGALWVGVGSRALRIALATLEMREFQLDWYFGSFFPLEQDLLVCSATRIMRLDPPGNLIWVSPELGLDGVLVSHVDHGVIEGQGEWDPPGGWRDFRLDLDRGELLA